MSKWRTTLTREVPKPGRAAFAFGVKNERGRYEISNNDASEVVVTAAFTLLKSADEYKARQVLAILFPPKDITESEGGEI